MKHFGWIKLHREILNSPLYPNGREFTEYEAWIDLLLNANFKDVEVVLGYDVHKVKRGEMIRSLGSLSERWRWSKSKVRRVLKLFEKLKLIRLKNITKATHITICKYDSYSEKQNASETQAKQKRNGGETQVKTVKESKKEKKGKNERIEDAISLARNLCSPTDEQLFEDFMNYWTESGEEEKDLRFEKEKTFNWKRRWSRWKRNEEKWGKKKVAPKKKPIDSGRHRHMYPEEVLKAYES